jgi:hypothetical protein
MINFFLNPFLRKILEYFFDLSLVFRKSRYDSKVFCIGYNKTGTTTVGKSFEILGYRNKTFSSKVWLRYYKNNKIVKILNYASKFESFDDLPWLKEDIIPILDKVFPKSKFVYLLRDEESWKKSYFNWRKKRFGDSPDVEKAWQEYQAHNRFVMDYFKDRPENEFIVLDVQDKNGFKKLADFLGKKTDRYSFPHFNQT